MAAGPTHDDIDALVAPATPHFAFQLRARIREVISELPADSPVRLHGEEQMEMLERLGHASTMARDGAFESRDRPGWDQLPASAPASHPLPPRR